MAAPRKDDVKAAVLNAAQVLLETGTWGDISLADIAKQSGVSKGTLYYHYKTKGEILFDIANRYLSEQWDDFIRWTEDKEKDTSLQRLVKYVVERDIASAGLRMHLLCEAQAGDEILREKLVRRYGEFQRLISEKIAQRTHMSALLWPTASSSRRPFKTAPLTPRRLSPKEPGIWPSWAERKKTMVSARARKSLRSVIASQAFCVLWADLMKPMAAITMWQNRFFGKRCSTTFLEARRIYCPFYCQTSTSKIPTNASRSAWSSSVKRPVCGLSISKTPMTFPSVRMGTTISELDALSQAMCPGNWWTSLTSCVLPSATAVPHTPRPTGISMQAGLP